MAKRKVLNIELFDPAAEELNLDKLITNPFPVNEKAREFTPDGIFSPVFFSGSDPTSPPSCSCGEIAGNLRLGETCPSCGGVVEFSDNLYNDTAWIDLNCYVIDPFFWIQIKNIVGDDLEKISADQKFDVDGNPLVDPENPLYNKGMEWLLDNLHPVLKQYATTEAHEIILRFIEEHWHLVFKRYVPVYSTLLRPGVLSGGNVFKFAKENTYFNQLVLLSQTLANYRLVSISINSILIEIQSVMNLLFEEVLKKLPDKHGFIRTYLLGCRINFTCTCVIVPARENVPWKRKMNHIELPYIAAVELYRFEIINLLTRAGFNRSEAISMIENSKLVYDDYIYQTLMEVDRITGGLELLLNRPPSLNIGSILKVRAFVKKNIDDLTMGIGTPIMPIMAADSDGDTTRTISLKTASLKAAFEAFNPKQLMISLNDGLFHNSFSSDKDHDLGTQTLAL